MNKIIEYSQYQTDIKQRIRELTWSKGKLCFILAAIVFPVAVFLIVMGHISADKEGLIMGYSALFLVGVAALIYLLYYFTFKKILVELFVKYGKDGKLDYLFKREQDEFCIVRRTDENTVTFHKSEIKKIDVMKKVTVVYLKNKIVVILPSREDVIELLNAPLGE